MEKKLHLPTKLTNLLGVMLLSLSISSIYGQTPPSEPAGCNFSTNIDYLELTGEGDGVLLKFKNFTAGTKYQVEMAEDTGGGSNWATAGEATDGSTNIVGLDKNKKYCFRLAGIDDCGKSSYSPIVCTSNLSGTQGGSQSITLTWNKPTEPKMAPSTKIIMEKEIVGCTTGNCKNRPYVTVLDTSLEEVGLDCQKIYAYQLTYTFKNDDGQDIIIKSDKVEVNPKSGSVSIAPRDLVTVGFMPNDEETVRIVVKRFDAGNYNFFRASAPSTHYVSIGNVPSNSIDDISMDPNSNAYCYKYEFEDQCGILSERSPEFCTVFLSGNSSFLNWTPYTFPQSVISNSSEVEYTVEFYDTNVNTWVPRFNTKHTSQGIFDIILNSKESQVKFRVHAKQFVTGTVSVGQFINNSYSNTVVINVPPNVFLPSAFTPNNDGINDVFTVYQKFIKEGSIVIYDRWGSILFETDDLSVSWDGTAQSGGNIVPSGNYAFRIKGISVAGETFSKTGYITLLR